MIKRLEVEDIIKILKVTGDEIENNFPCERGEFVQMLVSLADNPKALIIGDVADGKILGYLVAHDTSNNKPLSNHVFVIHLYSSNGQLQEYKDQVNEWAKEQGIGEVKFVCKDIKMFEHLGVEQIGIVGRWKVE